MSEPTERDLETAKRMILDRFLFLAVPGQPDLVAFADYASDRRPYAEQLQSFLAAALATARAEGAEEERERAAREVPTNWVHPLLSGPDCALPSRSTGSGWGCPDIERLLRAIAAAIRQGPQEDGADD